MRSHRTLIAILALLGAGCRVPPAPIALQGATADIAALAGQWDGGFSSRESGREGVLSFTLRAGSDTAYGDVVLIPRGSPAVRAVDAASQHAMHANAPEFLRIRFARVFGGEVEGVLEPYLLPECNCRATTVFRGVLRGDEIVGDYLTRNELGTQVTGEWQAKRKAAP